MSPTTMHNQFLAPGIEIRFHRETEIVETMMGVPKPDKDWRHFDKKGHAHVWSGDELPTLEEVVTGKTWVGDEYDGYETDVTEFRCRECGEVVVPKTITVHEPQYIAGPPCYSLVLHPSIREIELPIPDDDVPGLIAILQRMFDR